MTGRAPPLISVVMVSFHTGPVLFEAIASVLAQTVPTELILIDNGNPQDVTEKMKALAAQGDRTRLFHGHGNIGFSRGCNMGAKAARGGFLLFLNPDGVMPHDAVAKLCQHGQSLRRPYMMGARVVDQNGKDQRGCRRALLTPTTAFIEALHLGCFFPRLRLNRHQEDLPACVTSMPAISGAFMFITRDDFWSIGGFDEGYFLHVDDLDFCLRFRRAGGEIFFVPDVVVRHVGGTSNASCLFVEKHKAHGFIRYFHKNFTSDYPPLFLWLLDAAIWTRMAMRVLSGKWKQISS